MTAIIAFVIVLGVLILVHELGHFWAARAVDIRVERFSIGIGPVIWSVKRGETEWAISAIPLGGYVKMGGMHDEVMQRVEGGASEEDEEPREPKEPGPRDYDGKPAWQRAIVLSAGVAMNMLFAVVAYLAIGAIWGEPTISPVRVGSVVEGRLPPGTESLTGIPVGAEVLALGDRSVESFRQWDRALQELPAGPTELRYDDPPGSVTIRIPSEEEERARLAEALLPWLPAEVPQETPGTPAEAAGIEAGDRFVFVAGDTIRNWYDFVAAVEPRAGERVEVTVEREGNLLQRPIQLASRETEDPVTGEVRTVGYAGVLRPLPSYRHEKIGALEAIPWGLTTTYHQTGYVLGVLWGIVSGQLSPRSVGSVIFIAQQSGEVARSGPLDLLSFMAILSINLAILNLLPIPVLDGGHLLFLGIEAVRGRELSVETRLRWSNVGLLVLVGLMILAISNDILRILGV